MAVRILAAVTGGVNGSWMTAPGGATFRANRGAWLSKFCNRLRAGGSWALRPPQAASATRERESLRVMDSSPACPGQGAEEKDKPCLPLLLSWSTDERHLLRLAYWSRSRCPRLGG